METERFNCAVFPTRESIKFFKDFTKCNKVGDVFKYQGKNWQLMISEIISAWVAFFSSQSDRKKKNKISFLVFFLHIVRVLSVPRLCLSSCQNICRFIIKAISSSITAKTVMVISWREISCLLVEFPVKLHFFLLIHAKHLILLILIHLLTCCSTHATILLLFFSLSSINKEDVRKNWERKKNDNPW